METKNKKYVVTLYYIENKEAKKTERHITALNEEAAKDVAIFMLRNEGYEVRWVSVREE